MGVRDVSWGGFPCAAWVKALGFLCGTAQENAGAVMKRARCRPGTKGKLRTNKEKGEESFFSKSA